MNITVIKLIQRNLAEAGFYSAAIDGDRGPLTNAAIEAALSSRGAQIGSEWRTWSDKRQAIGYLQLICSDKGIDSGEFDGWWGPQTDFSYNALRTLIETGHPEPLWRDENPLDINPNKWPRQTPSSLTKFYGKHGIPKGFTPPMTRVACPWTLKLDWDRNVKTSRISCHSKVADSLGSVLAKVHAHYGDAEIHRLGLDLYGGCYNARKIRGGSAWSTHSWGIALDWNPSENKLKWGRSRASFAHPDYNEWWRFWEEEGWVSLGREKNFDWMHVQAAKL